MTLLAMPDTTHWQKDEGQEAQKTHHGIALGQLLARNPTQHISVPTSIQRDRCSA